MEGRKETLELLEQHGAKLRRKNGGRYIWDIGGRAFITSDPYKGKTDPAAWRNNYNNLRRLLGLPKNPTPDQPYHHRKSRNEPLPKSKPASQKIILPQEGSSQVVLKSLKGQLFKLQDERRRDEKLHMAVARLEQNREEHHARKQQIIESFQRRHDTVTEQAAPAEVLVDTTPLVNQPVFPPRIHPTPAEREAAFDKMAGHIRIWTPEEIVFADRIYDLCGVEKFREYLTVRKTSQGDEEMKEAIQQIKNQLAGIQAKRKQNDEVIKAAADAQEDNKNLDLAETELKRSIESLEKLAPSLAATKGFSIHKDAAPKTRAPRTTITPAGGNFGPAYNYLVEHGPADTQTIATAIGMDMTKVSAALSYDSTKGKHRVARDGETGRWHVITPANGHAPQHAGSFAAAS